MFRLLALLSLLAAPAAATQDGWPALFDVAGVAADDVLNLRAAPSADAEIRGALPPDATGVEVIRPNDDHTWGLVNEGEGTAWVSLAFLQRLPGQWDGASPEPAACFGTEPFWSLTFDGEAVALSSPDGTVAGSILSRPAPSNDRRRHGLILALDGLKVGSLRYEACGDGMSDRAFGLALDLIGSTVLSGCCTLSAR